MFSRLIIFSCIAVGVSGCVFNGQSEREQIEPSLMEREVGGEDDGIGGTGLNHPSLDPEDAWTKFHGYRRPACNGVRARAPYCVETSKGVR